MSTRFLLNCTAEDDIHELLQQQNLLCLFKRPCSSNTWYRYMFTDNKLLKFKTQHVYLQHVACNGDCLPFSVFCIQSSQARWLTMSKTVSYPHIFRCYTYLCIYIYEGLQTLEECVHFTSWGMWWTSVSFSPSVIRGTWPW